ncbi:MAG: glycoside hydrolase family 5 protein [Treponema sp.]|nr:glycoside hydrolase family 5 protein [Treponema sp.]
MIHLLPGISLKKLGVGLQYEALFNSILEADCEIDFGTEYTCVLNRPKPSKKEMHFIKEKGFKTLRVQFNPNPHMLDKNYTIDPRFMRNLKQVVDFAIEEGMYVIVCGPANDFMSEETWVEKVANDIHFAGYTISQESKKESKAFIQAVWKQIVAALNNSYDEHLIFETLNEPTDRFHEHTFQEKTDCAVCKKDFALLNEYNQMIVDTIRASGGNNAKRFIMVEGLGGGFGTITTNLFKLPKDKVKNRLIPAVHNYPMGVPPWNKTYYTESIKKNNITDCFKALDKAYFSKKIPVYISETGHANKAHLIMEAINCMKDFMAEVSNPKRSCAVVLHDSHNSETFYLYDKWKLQWFDTEYIDTVLYGVEGKEFPLSADFIKKNEVKIESIVGKNLLEAPVEIRSEGGAGIKGDVFVRSRPENYKLEFEVEKLSSKATIYLAYNDYKGNWNEVMTKSKVKLLKGGSLDGAMIKVKDNTVVVSIDNATSCEFETGGELYILGEDIIIKSVKVVE